MAFFPILEFIRWQLVKKTTDEQFNVPFNSRANDGLRAMCIVKDIRWPNYNWYNVMQDTVQKAFERESPGGHNIGVDIDEVLDTLLHESALLNFGDVSGQFQMM